MPCSRSSRSPSVSRARLVYSSPRSRLVRSTASIWSSKIDLESYSRRPMSVDLPSSTDPAGASLRMSMLTVPSSLPCSSEVPLALAVLHGGLARTVVGAGLAALGDPRRGDLGADPVQGRGRGRRGGGAAHVAGRAVADLGLEGGLVVAAVGVRAVGEQHAVAFE